jgi:hypothetical protein
VSARNDPRERLRRANPVPLDEAPTSDASPGRELFERIVAAPTNDLVPIRTHTRRRLAWVLIPAVLLAAAGTGYALLRKASDPLLTVCYAGASLEADRAGVSPSSDDPVAACRALWLPGGEFNSDGTLAEPPLQACLLDGGAIGVFPVDRFGGDICAALGLAAAGPSGDQAGPDAVLKLQRTLADRLTEACLNRPQALVLVQSSLVEASLRDWTVLAPVVFTQREPCASVAIDAPVRTITIVPIPPSSGP